MRWARCAYIQHTSNIHNTSRREREVDRVAALRKFSKIYSWYETVRRGDLTFAGTRKLSLCVALKFIAGATLRGDKALDTASAEDWRSCRSFSSPASSSHFCAARKAS
jgi:hypothetical protein